MKRFKRHKLMRSSRAPRCMAMRIFFVFAAFVSAILPVQAQINAESVTIMGRNALCVDDYLSAINYFNQAIGSKPFLSQPYFYRAQAKFTLEDYSGAEADCTKSIELNPFITEVYELRGLCRIHNENYEGAVSDYSRALKDNPYDQPSLHNRSLCYLQLKDYARADSDLTVLIKKYPNYYRAYLIFAQSYLEQKDTVRAMVWVDSLLKKNAKDGTAWSFKGRYELTREHYAASDTALSHAIALLSSDYDLFVLRAQARHALGRFGLAIADYDEAIRLNPDHFVAHYNRGLLRSFVGDLNRAIEDFDFVIGKEPDNTLAIYNRAQLRAQVGNLRGAIADYTTLINTYPNFTYGYMQRAELRRKIGDTHGALNDETVVARRNLDLTFGKKSSQKIKKIRKRSEHELEQYQQLVENETDTVRNVFGTLYGKVQNEKVNADPMPMYAPAFRTSYAHGYHSIGFLSEMNRYTHANGGGRTFVLTAETETDVPANAEKDYRQYERNEQKCSLVERTLVKAAIAAARYDYTTAQNEVNQAVQADSASVVALILRAHILTRSAESGTLEANEVRAHLSLAQADLMRAARLAPGNAFVTYNLGCLLLQERQTTEALQAFTLAISQDERLAEAYYNRALIYTQIGKKDEAAKDFSHAGQLGLYKAYAQIKQLK